LRTPPRSRFLRRCALIALTLTLSACGARGGRLEGEWQTVKEGDTLSAIAASHHVPIEDLVELNGLSDPSRIKVGQRLFIPSKRALETSSRPPSPSQTPSSTHRAEGEPTRRPLEGPGAPPLERVMALRWPLAVEQIDLSSPFGDRGSRAHSGLDLRAPEGTPTLCVLDGVVSRVDFDADGYGWYVVVDHGDGLESRYAHHSKNLVSEGQRVARGDQLGVVGSTGRSSGPHLHLELRYLGEPLDPLIYLPALPELRGDFRGHLRWQPLRHTLITLPPLTSKAPS
jgi:murein DD-endopeptidase MepM/ murein hydrolase activator NlpD